MKYLLCLAIAAVLVGQPIRKADRITDLQKKLDSGAVKLQYEPEQGYLKSVLQALGIPVSSQTLVFSKSSFQLHLIAPDRPRALYFNDDVYVGWTRGGSDIEVMTTEPKQPPTFYMLPQARTAAPKFNRETDNCTVCHDFFQATVPLPRLLMLSVLPDPGGFSIGAASLVTNDQSPIQERWGGWYVSGKTGNQKHLGNLVVDMPASTKVDIRNYAARADSRSNTNITDLGTRFEKDAYLSPHSDVAALMVLGHQTHVHNMIIFAAASVGKNPVATIAEPLVRAMLFADAVPLTEPVTGTSTFTGDFASRGPKDGMGRSLRELDLKTRLLKYPLSYLIYNEAFDGMPDEVRTYVVRRIKEVLNGEDKSGQFAHLSETDRTNILQILKETKPGF